MIKTPLSLYNKKIQNGLLQKDSAQESAVNVLETLYHDILASHPSRQNLWQRLTSFVWQSSDPDLQGVYMYGGVGRGKSMLMDLFYNSLPGWVKKRRIHFHAFMIEVHDYFHSRREDGDIDTGVDALIPSLSSIIASRSMVLCFDEFHVTDVTDAMILGRLFTALFDHGVVVVATSNWPPDRLYEGGLQRERFLPFIELLKTRMTVVHLDTAVDYRGQFLQDGGTYFYPLGAGSRAQVDDLFKKLTGKLTGNREILKVKGRNIVVNCAAEGVAKFSFAQLCETPHGAEDYLKIAETYHTVILENVPTLGYDRRNEAKRLMTLIDALYDTGTKLIVSAEAPPEKLYRGHDHAFEFVRTVSRLNEMQSRAYLEKKE